MFIAALCSMSVFADDINVNSDLSNGTYVEGAVQIGGTSNLNVYIVAEKTIASALQSDIYLPDGLTAESGVCTIDGYELVFTPHPELGNCVRLVWVNANVGHIDAQTPVLAAKIVVSAANTLSAGKVDVKVNNLDFAESYNNEVDNFITSITVQKTAIIEPQRGDYAFEAVPTCVGTGSTSMSIPVNFANEGYVDNISFNIEYPAGMLTTKVGKNYNLTVNKDRFDTGSDATLTVKATSGTAVSFTNAESDLVEPGKGNLLTIPVTLTDVADGVYAIKFTDIKVSVTNDEADPVGTETLPDYYVTVIVGQPAQEDAILYGSYSSTIASTFSTALKNVAIADVTAATVDDDAKFTDVLVNEKGGNSYYTRTSANYGTTVLPLNLTTENVAELYTIESMNAKSIVLTEAASVSANTPCIFKGTINVEGATPTLGVPSEHGLGETTFKGTYEATEIADGAGYYISSDGKFYSDGATVRPFRGYFDGTIAGVKSFSVFVNTANGLIDITDQLSDEAIYSLQGIRMNNAQKGINIKNGKKVYVK